MLKPVSNKMSFPQMEEGILHFWQEHDTFMKSLENRKDSKRYIFYDGPPFATGLPHYGHLLAGIIKDIAPRYQTMRGHFVERRFGWDCHGLPIEAIAQDKLGLAGAADILAAGVDVFNETCRSMVLTYVEEWRKTVTRMGRWVDFDNDYKTMDLDFMESIWWVFKQLWEQGRVYKSHRIMPYSWKLNTPLSNFEAGSNYQNVQDPAITVRVKLDHVPPGLEAGGAPVYALIWTTTPWTLFGNLAICVGPEIDYAVVRDKEDGTLYLLAEARLEAYYKAEDQYELLGRWKGADLREMTYEPIFQTFAGTPDCFRVLSDGFVSTKDGTGIVHLAPAFGEDDFRVCTAAGIPLMDYLDNSGTFTDVVPEYKGLFCKDADKPIIRRLKDSGQLVRQSSIAHSYPFCPRTDTPLLYRAIEAWYVKVEDLHERLAANNAGVHWVPAAIGEKRFGNWLKEAKDWNISRNRFWGSCIPVWINEADPADMICIGSIRELEALSGQQVTDLHKHHVDKILIQKDGKTYRRTPEVLDCWFESGSMPYAQQHYPFERADELANFFPADFIAEGLDQTRGWFYTLMLLATALFGQSPYRNVIVNGLVLAEDGRKMSKRLKNYPDPTDILNKYGADALRLYMIHSPIVRAEDLCFSEAGVVHSLRHLLIPWWNAYSFFVTYANIDGWEPKANHKSKPSSNLLDRWILSTLDRLTAEVVKAMDAYDLQQAVRPFVQFIDELTNWYIRRSRRRFWKSDDDADKTSAYETLHAVLLQLCQIAAPFTPFIAEEIYRNFRTSDMPESVHLCDFPLPGAQPRDEALEAQMQQVMTVVTLARQLRADFNLKVRQPLSALHIICRDPAVLDLIRPLQDIVADELNVKEVRFGNDETELAELTAKANFKTLGPKLGARMQKAVLAIAALDAERLAQLLAGEAVEIEVEGQVVSLAPEDVLLQRTPKEGLAVASDGALVIALETELTPELVREGLARELVNRIQNLRKAADLDVAEHITLEISADAALVEAISAHQHTIATETLARNIRAVCGAGDLDINSHPCCIHLQKST
ncbi:MAG: isoleucine--tRNA ligase [Verrucomicrobiota bacterium]|jgi:isoleucyl-tRNA synthetase|nr:isoleucine--tRNA ligase [Verrucomicrobiota bacterium]